MSILVCHNSKIYQNTSICDSSTLILNTRNLVAAEFTVTVNKKIIVIECTHTLLERTLRLLF